MGNAILIAAAAGLASALLAAAAAAGPGVSMILALFAPLPLMIVGFGWHPLFAVLGGAITAAALSAMIRGSVGVAFAVLVIVPAYAAATIVWRDDLDSRAKAGLLALGGCLYAVIAVLVGALSISFDYDALQAHLLRQSELVYRLMSGLAMDAPLEPVRGQDPRVFIRTYAQLVAPLSVLMLGLMYLINIWIAARVAEASNRLPPGRAPLSQMAYPRLLLPLSALALVGGMLPGYIGLTLEFIGVATVLALTALGFAVLHELTRGMAARPLILGAAWILTFVAGVPVLAMLLLGILDLAFGWRARIATSRGN